MVCSRHQYLLTAEGEEAGKKGNNSHRPTRCPALKMTGESKTFEAKLLMYPTADLAPPYQLQNVVEDVTEDMAYSRGRR
jgi:hypothetical protein